MALQFNPPSDVIDAYLRRRSSGEIIGQGLAQFANILEQQQKNKQNAALAQENHDIKLAQLASAGGTNAIDWLNSYRSQRGLPPIAPGSAPSTPSATPPPSTQTPVDASGNPIMGPVQGPALPGVGLGMAAQQTPRSGMGAPSPIIDHWNATVGAPQAGGAAPETTTPALGSDPAIQEFNQIGSQAYQKKYGSQGLAKVKTALDIQKSQQTKGMEPVVTEEQALKQGSVAPGTHIVKPMTPLGTVTWDSATPEMKAAARGVYEGRIRPSDMSFRDRGVITQLAEDYANKNGLPPFKAYAGEINAAMGKYATSGKLGQNALSLNTALGHAASAYQSYQKIQNTDQKWMNVPLNKLREQTNNPDVIALGVNLNALRGELATVFKNSGGTDQEIAHWRDYLDENLTPKQSLAALGKVDELLRSRHDAMEYQMTLAGGGPGKPLMSPHAQQTSELLGGQSGNAQPISSPKAGDVQDGYRYKGGDPGNPNSWEKI